MTQIIYNNNLQPHEVAFNKLYFVNMLCETKYTTYAEAEKSCTSVVISIIKKLRNGELDALIQMIENIR